MHHQPTITGVTPHIVIRAAATVVGTTTESVMTPDNLRAGRREGVQPRTGLGALARNLSAYAMNRHYGYGIKQIGRTLGREPKPIRLMVRKVEARVEAGHPATLQQLATMDRIVNAMAAATPAPAAEAA